MSRSSCACSSTAAACRRNRRCRRASSATARTTRTPSASPTWRARANCSPRPATRTASTPRRGQPLKLTFDTGNTTADALLEYEFFVAAWRELGLDVEIKATTYNQFQEKVRQRRLPDLHAGAGSPTSRTRRTSCSCSIARTRGRRPTGRTRPISATRSIDKLYRAMKNLPNDAERAELIKQMVAILERERPWIELLPPRGLHAAPCLARQRQADGHLLPVYKYKDVKPEMRARLQAEWNTPVRWPLYLLLALAIAAVRAGGQDLLPGAPVDGRLSHPPPRLRRAHRAGRAAPAVRPVLRRHRPRRHRPQGGGRAGAARGLRAMEEEPRLRPAAVPQPRACRRRRQALHRHAAVRALPPHAHLRFRPQRRRRRADRQAPSGRRRPQPQPHRAAVRPGPAARRRRRPVRRRSSARPTSTAPCWCCAC